jgi:type I restriction enzyme S subunit
MSPTSEWRRVLLAELAAPTRNALVGGPFGSDLLSADYTDSGVPVIRGENLSAGRWVSGPFVYVSEEKARKLSANTAGPLDVVFTQRGANHYRQVAVVPRDATGRFLISQSQMKLTVDPAKADPLFVYYLFRAPAQQQYLQRNAIQTGVPHTNLTILKKVPLNVPRLELQRRIVGILGAIDDKIEVLHRMNETLEAMARAIFKDWFVDFGPTRAKMTGATPYLGERVWSLHPDRIGESGLPDGWSTSTIGAETRIYGGTTPKTGEPQFWGGSHCWATPKDLSGATSPVLLETERRITDEGASQISSGILSTGAILLSSRAPIGYIAVTAVPTAINQGFIAMVCSGRIPNTYVWRWTVESLPAIHDRANGSTFMEISKTNFRPLPCVVPSPSLLAEYDRIVRPLLDKIICNERETRTLAQLRDLLLPRLLAGDLRVREAEAQAEVLL